MADQGNQKENIPVEEEEKKQDQQQEDQEQQQNKGNKLVEPFVHLRTDLANRKIVLEPTYKKDKNKNEPVKEGEEQPKEQHEPKFSLFKNNKGKQVIYQAIQDVHKHNQNQQQIQLSAKTTAAHLLVQVIADLQSNKILTINSTKYEKNNNSYDLIISITYHHPQ